MRRAAMAIAALLTVAIGCAGPAPTPAFQLPITEADAAFRFASRAAEIGGPFQPLEIVTEETRISIRSPTTPRSTTRRLLDGKPAPNRVVWRVTFAGPDGTETSVIETGERLGAVVQGQ